MTRIRSHYRNIGWTPLADYAPNITAKNNKALIKTMDAYGEDLFKVCSRGLCLSTSVEAIRRADNLAGHLGIDEEFLSQDAEKPKTIPFNPVINGLLELTIPGSPACALLNIVKPVTKKQIGNMCNALNAYRDHAVNKAKALIDAGKIDTSINRSIESFEKGINRHLEKLEIFDEFYQSVIDTHGNLRLLAPEKRRYFEEKLKPADIMDSDFKGWLSGSDEHREAIAIAENIRWIYAGLHASNIFKSFEMDFTSTPSSRLLRNTRKKVHDLSAPGESPKGFWERFAKVLETDGVHVSKDKTKFIITAPDVQSDRKITNFLVKDPCNPIFNHYAKTTKTDVRMTKNPTVFLIETPPYILASVLQRQIEQQEKKVTPILSASWSDARYAVLR